MDSNSFEMWGRIEIGLLLETSEGSPDLKTGVTELIFHTAGKIPSSSDCLKSRNIG